MRESLTPSASGVLAFGDFHLTALTRELVRIGKEGSPVPIPLDSRSADLLLLFLQRPGEVITTFNDSRY
jgi:DNA-binding winged helix-turn-helix (wHTH) protein